MINIGFTGTKKGITEKQFNELTVLFSFFCNQEECILHQGLCIGADCEAAELAKSLGFKVYAYPGFHPKFPDWRGSRGAFIDNDKIFDEKPFLDRDHDIVDNSDFLIATPNQPNEVLRSGTWATIRYARKMNKNVIIIFPDGSLG